MPGPMNHGVRQSKPGSGCASHAPELPLHGSCDGDGRAQVPGGLRVGTSWGGVARAAYSEGGGGEGGPAGQRRARGRC